MAGQTRYTAVLDACVLYPVTIANILMELAWQGIYAAKWTKEIDREWVDALMRDRPESKTVRIATMHRAKGLEFDEVIVISPSQGFLTGLRSETNKRLKYVALSRAKKIATAIQY